LESRVVFGKDHVEDLIRLLSRRSSLAKGRVVPLERLWRDPLSFAFVTGVLDDDPHAVMPVIITDITQYPDAGMIHLDDG
jgi:hypothetical protein